MSRWRRDLLGRDGRTGLARPAIVLAAALVAGASLAVWLLAFGPGERAEGAGASMGLQVYADKAKSSLVCDLGTFDRKCDIDANTAFSIDVHATVPPPNGYTAYRVKLQYETGLTLQQQTGLDENLLGECIEGTETKGVGLYSITCKQESRTTFSGPIVNVQFVCGPGGTSAQIDIVGGTKDSPSVYIDPGLQGSIVFLKGQPKGEKVVVDAVQINCVDPTPTPTPTFTPTRTSTPTQTRTPTATPTPTTPLEPGKVKMTIEAFADAGQTLPVCTSGEVFRKCDVFAGEPFSIDIHAAQPPANGYTAYKIVVQLAGDITLVDKPGLSENQSPGCITGSESTGVPKGKPGLDYRLSCKVSDTPIFYNGVLATLNFMCNGDGGSAQIDLVGGAGANVSSYVNPNIGGSIIFLKSVPKGNKEVADSILVNCHTDFDLDGCTNTQELGANATSGGARNPFNFWDYFDVDTENGSGAGTHLQGAISLADVLKVAGRFGMTGDPTIDPLSDASAPGYHPRYDRGPIIGANIWNRSPADGAIGLADVLTIAGQYGHVCI